MSGANIPIDVYVNSTHVDIKANADGYIGVRGGHIKYALDKLKAKKYEYSQSQKKFIQTGETHFYHYDKSNQIYRLPRYALKYLETCFRGMNNYGIPVRLNKVMVESVTPREVDFHMDKKIKDRPGQAEVIEHLSEDRPMLACRSNTGFGKTTVSIKTAILKKVPFLVICDGLTDQWVESILDKTDMQGTDVAIVKEGKSITKIFKNLEKGIVPSAVICSIQTVRNYIQRNIYPYNELPTWEEFLEKLGIGIIIKDEYHLNFKTCVLIDLFSNVRNNIYLSATPRRNDQSENKVFDRIYPNEILNKKADNNKHVDIDLCASLIRIDVGYGTVEDKFKTNYGYSHRLYEEYLLNNTGKLEEFFKSIENVIGPEYFNKYSPGEVRCVVFCYLKSMCNKLATYLSHRYPDFNVKTRLTGDPESNMEADVIISTLGGLGTGHDIPKLVLVINTISTKSQPKLEQAVGRLRPVPGYQCKYIDIYNKTIGFHRNHLYIKRKIYRNLANRLDEINI